MAWRLLDVCCCEGGGSEGYRRAGFEVTGCDVLPQARYPFPLVEADGLAVLGDRNFMSRFDAIHASWPCQFASRASRELGRMHRNLIPEGRRALQATGLPWVMENVVSPRHDLRPDLKLCACMFPEIPEALRRERWFETSWAAFDMRQPCYHTGISFSVGRKGGRNNGLGPMRNTYLSLAECQTLMGIPWASQRGLGEAIPPPYTEYVGRLLAAHLEERAALLLADADAYAPSPGGRPDLGTCPGQGQS